MIVFGPGLNNLWLGGIMFLCLVCLLFAGQSGGREMLLSLKKKFIKHPCEIICSACAFMGFWAGLYPESMKEIIMAAADSMLKTALRILGSQRGSTAGRPRTLQAPADPAIGSDDEDSDED